MFDALPAPAAANAPAIPSALQELDLTDRAMKEEYLNRELEVELARAWREDKCRVSRDRLVTSHLRLAIRMAKKMRRGGGSANDLMQEAALGLMRATDKYDPDSGFRFSTYAQWWIKAALQDAVMRDNSSVRLKSSSNNRTAFFTLARVEARAELKLRRAGRTPTRGEVLEEAAAMMGMDAARLEEVKATMPGTQSLNEKVSWGADVSCERIDLLEGAAPTAEEITIRNSSTAFASNAIAEAMACLTDREKRIIQSRTMSLEPLTLDDLSRELGVSRERVRQVEVKAMDKLRTRLAGLGIRNLAFLEEAA